LCGYRIRAIIGRRREQNMRKFGWLVLAASAVLPSAVLAGDKMTIDQVPALVRATIERETRGGSVKEIERETKGGVMVYEVEFTRDNKKYEMHVGQDGNVLKQKSD
jgi:hypothetical protein